MLKLLEPILLEKASKRMKKWADKKRRPDQFKVGDLVLIKMDQLRIFLSSGTSSAQRASTDTLSYLRLILRCYIE